MRIALEKSGIAVRNCDWHSDRLEERFDFCNPHEIRNALGDCDGVIHLAALSRVIWGEMYPALCKQINSVGLKTLANAMRSLDHKPWLIYASSREIYGTPRQLPCSPESPPNPENLYARTKLAGEALVQEMRQQGFTTAILRFSNVFGTTDDYSDRVVPAFSLAAATGGVLHVHGQDSIYDFTPVPDAANAMLLTVSALDSGEKRLPPIDVVTGRATSLLELAQMTLRHGSGEIIQHAPRTFYPARFQGDPRRAKAYLGWAPHHPLEDAIERLVKDFKQLGGKSLARTKNHSWVSAAI